MLSLSNWYYKAQPPGFKPIGKVFVRAYRLFGFRSVRVRAATILPGPENGPGHKSQIRREMHRRMQPAATQSQIARAGTVTARPKDLLATSKGAYLDRNTSLGKRSRRVQRAPPRSLRQHETARFALCAHHVRLSSPGRHHRAIGRSQGIAQPSIQTVPTSR